MKAPKRKRIESLEDVTYSALLDYTYCSRSGDVYSDSIESSKHTYEMMLARGYDMWEQVLIEKAWERLNTHKVYA